MTGHKIGQLVFPPKPCVAGFLTSDCGQTPVLAKRSPASSNHATWDWTLSDWSGLRLDTFVEILLR